MPSLSDIMLNQKAEMGKAISIEEAGYVKRGKGRRGQRKRRERRPLFSQILHLDGSEHEWLAL